MDTKKIYFEARSLYITENSGFYINKASSGILQV